MAFRSNPARTAFAFFTDRQPGLAARFAVWWERRREARRIARELSGYNDRHLAELGLRRSDIPDVARGRFAER